MSVIIRMRLDDTKRIEIKSNTKYNTIEQQKRLLSTWVQMPSGTSSGMERDNNKIEYVIPLIHEKYKHTHIE